MSALQNDTQKPSVAQYDYVSHGKIAGPLQSVPRGAYKVKHRRLMKPIDFFWAFMLVISNLALEGFFLYWLFRPEHFSWTADTSLNAATIIIVSFILIIELFRLINIFTLCLAALLARDPVPVKPKRSLRVAFTTTIVPSKEPYELIKHTLGKMTEVTYAGKLDVWLLDEGNEKYIRQDCKKMGVNHFSRKGVKKWNVPDGQFKARTKHGNLNAWLDAHGDDYDVVMSVDADHAPLKGFAQRILGYFRDPDVAFVVGPQVYGNYDNFVTKGAESQAYLFQAAIQRAGNAYSAAMFVGTNHAYRVQAWREIGGFQDSITEDMLTSLQVHSRKNPNTGRYWKSVYTPDVLAVGEGPASWTDFFSQQLRWSRGSNEILVKNYPKLSWRLTAGKRLHYTLMMAYYPSVAISWGLGILLSMLFMTFGLGGVHIPGNIWLALYVDAAVAQAGMYIWLRRYNVSPHEPKGSPGVAGMFMSMVASPVYATALSGALLRRKLSFVVTPKGDSASPDGLRTFSKHLLWVGLAGFALVLSFVTGQHYPGIMIWPILTILVSLAPLFIWWRSRPADKRRSWTIPFARMRTTALSLTKGFIL